MFIIVVVIVIVVAIITVIIIILHTYILCTGLHILLFSTFTQLLGITKVIHVINYFIVRQIPQQHNV